MKFYALHRFNTLVKKGEYKFENLPKIYCIGILAKRIFTEIADYHNIGIYFVMQKMKLLMTK